MQELFFFFQTFFEFCFRFVLSIICYKLKKNFCNFQTLFFFFQTFFEFCFRFVLSIICYKLKKNFCNFQTLFFFFESFFGMVYSIQKFFVISKLFFSFLKSFPHDPTLCLTRLCVICSKFPKIKKPVVHISTGFAHFGGLC